jgi:hypothetical protein
MQFSKIDITEILLKVALNTLTLKSGLIEEGRPSPEENNLVVFYYLCATEIWPYKRGGLFYW